jgi:hypothetical protein
MKKKLAMSHYIGSMDLIAALRKDRDVAAREGFKNVVSRQDEMIRWIEGTIAKFCELDNCDSVVVEVSVIASISE